MGAQWLAQGGAGQTQVVQLPVQCLGSASVALQLGSSLAVSSPYTYVPSLGDWPC